MLYLFALVEGGAFALGEGWAGRPLEMVEVEGVGGVVCAVGDEGIEGTEGNLWHHEGVVERLMEETAVLPVRFGTMVEGRDELRALLKKHHGHYRDNLAFVRGRVELSVRVLWEPPNAEAAESLSPLTAESGTAYLMGLVAADRQKQQVREQAVQLCAALQKPLWPLSVAHTEQILVTERMLLTAAYLVEQGDIGTFKERVEELDGQYSELQVLCTGPWPPYHFVRPV